MDVKKDYFMQRNGQRRTDHDEQLRQVESAIAEALRKSGYHALRRLDCDFDGALFTLRGRVSTYYEKQMAQEIVLSHIGGRTCLDNQLEVVTTRQRENRRVDTLESTTRVATAPVALLTLS